MTIYELAKELNMTPSMISRALSPNGKVRADKRKVILEAAKKYDFIPNSFASRLSMNSIRIGIIINSVFEVNKMKMLAGIKKAYDELKDYKIEYDFTVVDVNDDKLIDYKKIFDKYTKYDGLIISGMGHKKYKKYIEEYKKINPNIVQVQSPNEDVEGLCVSMHDEVLAADIAADFICNCLKYNARKNVLLFTGNTDSKLHKSSQTAFEKACLNNGLSLLGSVDMKDDEKYFEKILADVMNNHNGSIDAIYITSGISAPLCEYLKENGIDIILVTFDTYDVIAEYMGQGIISATIYQDVTSQMKKAFKALSLYLINGNKPDSVIYTDVQLVFKSNIHLCD